MRILPVDGERFVDFDVLAGFDTTATKDALVRIVPVKRIRGVNLVRLLCKRNFLMIHREHLGRVMHRAVSVIVVAHRAVKHMILEQTVEGFPLRGISPGGLGLNLHAGGNLGGAGSPKFAVDLHHASVAGLDRAQLRVVANLRNLFPSSIDDIDEVLACLCFLADPVDN